MEALLQLPVPEISGARIVISAVDERVIALAIFADIESVDVTIVTVLWDMRLNSGDRVTGIHGAGIVVVDGSADALTHLIPLSTRTVDGLVDTNSIDASVDGRLVVVIAMLVVPTLDSERLGGHLLLDRFIGLGGAVIRLLNHIRLFDGVAIHGDMVPDVATNQGEHHRDEQDCQNGILSHVISPFPTRLGWEVLSEDLSNSTQQAHA